jgi:hypothetical protein
MASKAISPLKGKPLRNPGQSLDKQIQDLLDDNALFYFFAPFVFWIFAGLEWWGKIQALPRRPELYAIVALAFSCVGIVRLVQIKKQIRALRLGRDGEIAVGQFLERLRSAGAHVFHDIPGDGFNLDHVVISRHGIFVVETKTLSKPYPKATIKVEGERILVAGRDLDRNPFQQVRAQTVWLAQMLSETTGKKFPVRGAIVFPGWFVEPMPRNSKPDIWVLEPKALPAFIENERVCLDDSDVSLAAYHLSRYVRSS